MREEEAPSPAVEPTEEEDAAQSTTKRGRHRVLACATLASIINAFMFMNFSPVVELSRRRFRVSEGQVSWLYSAALLATLPCLFQCMNQIVAATAWRCGVSLLDCAQASSRARRTCPTRTRSAAPFSPYTC